MANDGNKAGEVYVEIKADAKPLDATLAALPAKAKAAAQAASAAASQSFVMGPTVGSSSMTMGPSGTGLGGGAAAPVEAVKQATVEAGDAAVVAGAKQEAAAVKAAAANNGLLTSLGRIKSAFARMFIPVAVAVGVVKLIEYVTELQEKTKNLGNAYAEMGNVQGRTVAKRIRDIRGESDAVKDLLEDTNAYIETLKKKRDADMAEWTGVLGAAKAAAINRRQEDIINDIGDAYATAADKATGFFKAVQGAQADRAADDAEKAVKAAKAAARLSTMDGENAIMEKAYQDVDALEEKKTKAKSDRERDAYDEQIKIILDSAEYAAERERKSHQERLDNIAREAAEERANIERNAQAKSQALADFNNQARASLNDLLNTAGIQTGMDKIANILLAIKGSQGGV